MGVMSKLVGKEYIMKEQAMGVMNKLVKKVTKCEVNAYSEILLLKA